jgi:uncharacterized lipoprotein YajG
MFKKGIVVLLLSAMASGCASETKLCRNSPPAPLISMPINAKCGDSKYTLLQGDPRKPGSRWVHYRLDGKGKITITHDVFRTGPADYTIYYDDSQHSGVYEIKSENIGNNTFRTNVTKDGVQQDKKKALKELEGIFGPGPEDLFH